ncbi:MAG: hypothetical protein QXN96_06165, partial [Candidatus Bathyarchaeia archaeon]
MVSENPLAEFRRECESTLSESIKKLSLEIPSKHLTFEKPPIWEFGQLASSICFELAKNIGEKPLVLAERLISAMDKPKFSLISDVTPAGGGYINFHANFAKFSELTIESVRRLDDAY